MTRVGNVLGWLVGAGTLMVYAGVGWLVGNTKLNDGGALNE